MAASASANELSVETRTAGAHTTVIVTGRVTVDSSPRLRPVLHEALRNSSRDASRTSCEFDEIEPHHAFGEALFLRSA